MQGLHRVISHGGLNTGDKDMQQHKKNVNASGDFLCQVQDLDKNELYRIGKMRTFAKNEFLFKAGENDMNVWILTSGRIKLFASSTQGRDVLLWYILAGDIFGLAECLQEQPRSIYARAAVASEVLSVPHTLFKNWLSLRPDIAYCLMKIMAVRMRELGRRFLSVANGNIQMEIAQLLIRLGSSYGTLVGQYVHVGIPLTVQDIADMAGANRPSVSTCLTEMKRQGIIDIIKRSLIIKNPENLQQIAQGAAPIIMLGRRTKRQTWLSAASSG